VEIFGLTRMTIYDYIVIGFYLAFTLLIGAVYQGFNRTAGDYFRGGGGMLWWVAGVSGFMGTFSAWSFTGGAAKAYETGTFFLLLYGCNIASLVFTYFVTAARFRQMRIMTPVDGVRKRFGDANEQVFAWLPIPFNIVTGGLALYTISVFMHGVFGVNITLLIVTLGVIITVMTMLGGAWAATAGDFVQLLLVLAITVVMAFLTLQHTDVGGAREMIQKVPLAHFDWTVFERPWILVFFALTLMINQLVQNNSLMLGASKYVFVKSGADARRAALISIAGFLLLAPIWMIPAMASTILHPDLAAQFPKLNNPREGAYVAMAITLLPAGLLGLLVSAIFAASVAFMNNGLNVAAGTFVRNFYVRLIRRDASEERQIRVGRIFTSIYGCCWIGAALFFMSFRSLPLFDLLLLAAASIQIPMTVPQFLGMFVRRTPSWSGWSTMVAGFIVSIGLRFVLTADLFNALFSPAVPFSPRELGDLNIAATTATLFAVCISWFFATKLFYRQTGGEYERQVDQFFAEMKMPIDEAMERGPEYDDDNRQYRVLGNLCLIYGGFALLLLLIPNSAQARLCILFCGLLLAAPGAVMRLRSGRLKSCITESVPVEEDQKTEISNSIKV
jgi:solute:Na+ symporter, SSS family